MLTANAHQSGTERHSHSMLLEPKSLQIPISLLSMRGNLAKSSVGFHLVEAPAMALLNPFTSTLRIGWRQVLQR